MEWQDKQTGEGQPPEPQGKTTAEYEAEAAALVAVDRQQSDEAKAKIIAAQVKTTEEWRGVAQAVLPWLVGGLVVGIVAAFIGGKGHGSGPIDKPRA